MLSTSSVLMLGSVVRTYVGLRLWQKRIFRSRTHSTPDWLHLTQLGLSSSPRTGQVSTDAKALCLWLGSRRLASRQSTDNHQSATKTLRSRALFQDDCEDRKTRTSTSAGPITQVQRPAFLHECRQSFLRLISCQRTFYVTEFAILTHN